MAEIVVEFTEDGTWEALYAGDIPDKFGCLVYGTGATYDEAVADLIENHPSGDV